jgi:acetate kinase
MTAIKPSAGGIQDGLATLNVLALNSGSSSLKFGFYKVDASGIETRLAGEAEGLGGSDGRFHALDSGGAEMVRACGPINDQGDAIHRIGKLLSSSGLPTPDVIGHRIVHGGPDLRAHCLIDASVVRRLEAASVFAPLHGSAALEVLRFAEARFPDTPQAACFDTAFHSRMPDIARVLPIPTGLRAEGVQRYGFHGLSCESILRQLGPDIPDRLIIAHLGAGASVTAVEAGKSIDTSMGLTPTGGVIMGTRSGDLDPGVLLYLMRQKGLDAAAIEDLVDRRSGLLGVSDVSGDMRALHQVSATDPAARLAERMFCYSVGKQIAAMISVLDGADAIVFTGGIGENDSLSRAAICERLAWIGIALDPARNGSGTNPISTPRSRCTVHVLPSLEDEQIARHACALLAERGAEAPGR